MISFMINNENTPVRVVPDEPCIDYDLCDVMMNLECLCGALRYCQTEPCGDCERYDIAGFRVTEEATQLMNSEEETKKRVWYHVTDFEDWATAIMKTNLVVHLGTIETVLDLMRIATYETPLAKKFTLYSVMLDEKAVISPITCQDLINKWTRSTGELFQLTRSDFVRYVNSYENAGSISLIGNPKKMTVLSETKMSIKNGITRELKQVTANAV